MSRTDDGIRADLLARLSGDALALLDELATALAVIAKVRALHRDTRPANGPHACVVCGEFEWPCETLTVLAAVPTEPTGGQE